jgi:23S rRNA (cytosine1962-C5)-methyltransferase
MDRKPALRVRVTAVAEKMARSGHPWIFADSVTAQNRAGETGELAVVYDRRDRFLAVGLFDPDSPIRVRILHVGQRQLIDDAWFQAKIARAFGRRESMFDASTTGYRCINGESDGLPGLVADRYDDTLALKLYTTAWMPRLRELAPNFGMPGSKFGTVVLRLSRNIQKTAEDRFGFHDGQVLFGRRREGPVIFLENGLRFESDPWRGQKTGFFLDQRDNRHAVRQLAEGRSLLNLFSFSGGFSVAAAAGGARSTLSLDISEHAVAAARRNFALNLADVKIKRCQHETVRADAFEWLQQAADRKFDIVVVDPPSLARRESERSQALEAYGRLIAGAVRRLQPGGLLVACSCSAHVKKQEFFDLARESARKSGRSWAEVETTGHAPDHAATFAEGEYLKAIYMRL